jgi:hypothetical protein
VIVGLFAALVLLTATGCADAPRTERVVTSQDATALEVNRPALPPLAPDGRDALGTIDIGGGEKAFLALPVGAREPRALIVGVHGAGDRPDWSCYEWQQVTAGWAIVVCPHGVVHPVDRNAFVWGSADAIATSADRAVAAVRARYGDHILDAPLVYAAWSQGASLAAEVIRSRPGVYDRAVLVEVGYTPLDPNVVAQSFAGGGVTHAIVSCSSPNCRSFAARFVPAARRHAIATRTVDVGDRGHWFDEPVFRALAPTFAWMYEDDLRYQDLGADITTRWM